MANAPRRRSAAVRTRADFEMIAELKADRISWKVIGAMYARTPDAMRRSYTDARKHFAAL